MFVAVVEIVAFKERSHRGVIPSGFTVFVDGGFCFFCIYLVERKHWHQDTKTRPPRTKTFNVTVMFSFGVCWLCRVGSGLGSSFDMVKRYMLSYGRFEEACNMGKMVYLLCSPRGSWSAKRSLWSSGQGLRLMCKCFSVFADDLCSTDPQAYYRIQPYMRYRVIANIQYSWLQYSATVLFFFSRLWSFPKFACSHWYLIYL